MGAPYFLILGAQRAGTTSLWTYLRLHEELVPAVCPYDLYLDYGKNEPIYLLGKKGTHIKETKFFSSMYNGKNLTDYESFFNSNRKGYESSVEYFHTVSVTKKIKKAYKKLKFIVLLRDPIKRAWSHYWHEVNYNKTEYLPFEQAIRRKLKTIVDHYFFAYLQTGHYAEHLKRWFNLFGKENFMIVQSEQFFSQTDYWFGKIQQFLDLKNIISIGKYENFGINADYPEMDDKIRKFLVQYYEPHNEKLYKLLTN